MAELKIALVGSAPASLRLAPYQDPEWQIWGCSPGLFGYASRVTEWYELHLWEPGQPWFSPEYCQWLKNLPTRGVKLWTGAPVGDLPGSEVFPFDEIQAEFDPHDWFCSSTVYWMMARAIKMGATKIGFWGIDMAAGEEYEMQRAGLHFLSYIARARGIEVGIPMESDLFTPRFRYGQHEWSHSFRKWRARRAELDGRVMEADRMSRAKADEATFLRGAIDDVNYMHSTWVHRNAHLGPDLVPKVLQAPVDFEPSAPIELHEDPPAPYGLKADGTPKAKPGRKRTRKGRGVRMIDGANPR
jgi:hypothetical protein